ncbi:3'-5' exonuclease [Halpernia frigidisoli]|uniref:DNA polymerase-3 subunit epsilon n=1 Tax=Halpernia frigidisoli TaxID=1125876 RepID=A0A1I3HSU7_9FLAO|nr:3'-5' exonuclease [Halpernia frigidisoli]SFI38703.1 DNA polymerase-3 subunit epsilon [Halpernia frigidisoli]
MYSIIDIESNGAAFREEQITEIAIYKFDGHQILDQFISMVNPLSEITPFVQKLTGITPNMVRTAPKFFEIAKRIVEITENTTVVGHNVDFDYRMLRQSFGALGFEFERETIDTIPLARKLIPDEKSYSLSKLCKSIGIPLTEKHRAGGDARATLDLFKLLMLKDQSAEIIQKQQEEARSKTFLNKIRKLTENLPSKKGLVYFQDENGKLLYLDFVTDLYRISKNVLNSKAKKWYHIQQLTEQINYELVGNEVLARIMMLNKKITKDERALFGLFFINEKFSIKRLTSVKKIKPLVKLKTFSQSSKVLKYAEEFSDFETFNSIINLEDRNELWISEGRTLGEKSFIIIENGILSGFGFYELYHQIKSWEMIKKLKIDISFEPKLLENYLKLALLKNYFEIISIPK